METILNKESRAAIELMIADGIIAKDAAERYFPELKESEDEKVKRILHSISSKMGFHLRDIFTEEEFQCFDAWSNAWLEKQGEQGEIDYEEELKRCKANPIYFFDKYVKVKLKEQKPANKIQLGKKYKCIASPRYSTFMRGEIYKPEDKFLCSLMNFCSDCFEPIEDNEQKPADKVEPKFKVGDWVVIDGEVLHVKEVTEDGYLTDEGGLIPFRNEKEAHIWTIQDAKEGDVLACGNDIVIFKENSYNPKDKSGCMFVYCSCNNFYEIGGINPTDYKPATKEQRELLFQKMKEAGYEWDAKKKELIKEVDNLHNYLYSEQSPVWSEEDENRINHLISYFENKGEFTIASWLKSLKEKYAWMPSDEQMDAVKDAIDYLGGNTKIVRKHLMSLYDQLKKLREELL